MNISGKLVAVIGYGKSGKAALELLKKLGAKRVIYDQKQDVGTDAFVVQFALPDRGNINIFQGG